MSANGLRDLLMDSISKSGDTRTARSVQNAIVESFVRDCDIAGHIHGSPAHTEAYRKLILAESSDAQFAAALETVSQKILDIFPVEKSTDKTDKSHKGTIFN